MSDAAHRLASPGVTYRRFMIMSQGRTGSTLLAMALNASPEVHCFGEIFNFTEKIVDFRIEGYDPRNKEDLALRASAPLEFLKSRIFCPHAEPVRAVGFKFQYGHFWGYPGLWEALAADRSLAVIHLKRRNLLRVFASEKIAWKTGSWESATAIADEHLRRWTPAKFVRAAQHPSRTLASMWERIRRHTVHRGRVRTVIRPDELEAFIEQSRRSIATTDETFRDHAMLSLHYEDMAADPQRVFTQAQDFVGVSPRELPVRLQRQNPEPMQELIANFDEVRAALRDTPDEWMLQE